MFLRRNKIERFWISEKVKSLEPKVISLPEEYNGNKVLSISASKNVDSNRFSKLQKRTSYNDWLQVLPTLDKVKYLWVYSRTF